LKKITDINQILISKEFNAIEDLAKIAESDPYVLEGILQGVISSQDTLRFNSFMVLSHLAEHTPSVLYPHWQFFVDMLSSSNAYHRSIGVRLIADLTAIDKDKRFDAIFKSFYDLLYDEKVMVARYMVQSTSKIFKFKPYLIDGIVKRLLGVEQESRPRSQKDLVCADIIEAFNDIYNDYPHRDEIMAFVKRQLGSSSPKGRKAAADFLKSHNE
jgi:hypothetical protein